MDHSVIHFEIAADDPNLLKQFYTELFGWKIEATPEMPEYMMVTTKAEGEPGINGGLMKKQMPQQVPMNYVMVESVADFAEKAKRLGGQVVVPKTPIPKMGYFAVCLDPENNPIGLWENEPSTT